MSMRTPAPTLGSRWVLVESGIVVDRSPDVGVRIDMRCRSERQRRRPGRQRLPTIRGQGSIGGPPSLPGASTATSRPAGAGAKKMAYDDKRPAYDTTDRIFGA